jgi:hypothetical protein
MTVEPAILADASAAVGFLAPYLVEAGKGMAKKVGENSVGGAGKLLGWMRGKLTGRGKQALDDLDQKPDSAGYQAVLSERLAELLEAEPSLRDELRSLLPSAAQVDQSMHQTLRAGAKGAQIRGDSNKVDIR